MTKAREFWNKSADNYDKTEGRFDAIHRRSRELAKGHLKKTDLVLDYGCGTGTTACELAGRVREIRGIDISDRMIELAETKAAAAALANVAFTQGDIFDEDLAPGSFDVVLAFNMLHTVPDPDSVIDRVHELLKPDGLLLSVTPCLADKMSIPVRLQILLVGALGRLGVIPVPIRRLRSRDLDKLITRVPLSVIETEEIFAGASSYFVAAEKADAGRAPYIPPEA